ILSSLVRIDEGAIFSHKRVRLTPIWPRSVCSSSCEARRRFQIWLNEIETSLRFKATVTPPWKLVQSISGCPGTNSDDQRLLGVASTTLIFMSVYSDDPNAPEANVVIETEALEDDELECP